MIMREWQNVTRRVFKPGLDDYGQFRKNGYDDYTIEMVVHIYSQSNVDNPRFLDIDKWGLTENEVDVGDQIIIDSKTYNVRYTIPSGRYL